MELYLIRHPRPAVAPGICYGQTDLGLAEPAAEVAARLRPLLPADFALHASPLARARLLAEALQTAGVGTSRIDLGHVGIFKALAQTAGLLPQKEEALFDCLQSKDLPGLRELLVEAPEGVRAALLALPTLYGGVDVLARAREVLPRQPEIVAALDDLQELASRLAGLPISFDLADLRGYHYQIGRASCRERVSSPV